VERPAALPGLASMLIQANCRSLRYGGKSAAFGRDDRVGYFYERTVLDSNNNTFCGRCRLGNRQTVFSETRDVDSNALADESGYFFLCFSGNTKSWKIWSISSPASILATFEND
jgi:hypothetical protein